MKLGKKVTDFIVLEEGNIGRKSAVVTGAALASSLLGTVLLTPHTTEGYIDHCDGPPHYLYHMDGAHWNTIHEQSHYDVEPCR
jgi:hypothetical protein